MKRLALLPLLATSTLLGGCEQLFGPKVGCADDNTVKLVRQIFDQELGKQLDSPLVRANADAVRSAITVSVDTILADSADKSVHKYTCRATLSVKLPAAALEKTGNPFALALIGGEGVQATPQGLQVPVTYTSQLTANGKEQYVEMQGHVPLASAIGGLALLGSFAPAAASAPASAPAPEPAAEAAPVEEAAAPPDDASADRDPEACVSEKVDAFHAEKGEDVPVTQDQLDEWRQECGAEPQA